MVEFLMQLLSFARCVMASAQLRVLENLCHGTGTIKSKSQEITTLESQVELKMPFIEMGSTR
jgi:hypothetical protein